MCGIAGILALRPVNRHAVEVMNDCMRHRGPDGEGVWESEDSRIILGHRRLAILDPSPAGAQPMVSIDGDFVLTYNGEIYNYLELRESLKETGSEFRSTSDSEVLVEGYAQEGKDFLKSLNGMFAFAIYDSRRHELFCARDRFGEKPLLYVQGPGFFAFASEYKALLSLAEVKDEIDTDRLLTFLHQPRLGLDSGRDTVFTGIKQLLPGECLTVDTKSLELNIKRYWSPKFNPEYEEANLNEAVARFRSLLSDSVKIRMRSDVSVGSCLSGGLDSSSIVCLNQKLLGDPSSYQVFTGRFPGTSSDEWSYAEQVISKTQVQSHVVEPLANSFLEELPDFIWHNELPVGSASQYAQWCVFRLAKLNDVTVLLDGQGADELLGGYEQYFRVYLSACRANGDYCAEEEADIRKRYPRAHLTSTQSFISSIPIGLRYHLANLISKGSDFRFGLSREALSQITQLDASIDHGPNMLNDSLREDAFSAHLPTLLRYGDRNSMAHSREVRLPFCDHRIAEFSLSLAPKILMGDAQTKRLLREAMKGILPETVRTRWNKQGFRPPQENWICGPLMNWVEETLSSSNFINREIWNVQWWHSVLRRLRAGETHLAWEIWRPLICEAWYTFFISRASAMPQQSIFSSSEKIT